ncbi:MAG TPA: MerR family transcriptional regulator [Solirubrobacteraceae bacterium]|jgi:DNA-binding transcriptional MerR regulator|nr:MerR family transcriptional regulator [Solirubrobacteraceae bacterium]
MSSLRKIEPNESPNQLTIEQLAAESGMSVRNIRAHQARGLLAAPEVRMRVGYYGPEHVAQLRLIRDLQDDGFNLGGIKRLLDDTHGTAERLLRFKRTLTAATRSERAETLSIAELAERFRISTEEAAAVLTKAQRLGVLVPVGGEQYEVPSPSLLSAAEDVMRSGISLGEGLAMLEEIERHAEALARSYVKLFLSDVWEPFQAAGMPQERWPEIEDALGRLRPLASQALMVIFEERMSAQVEDAFGEITRRLSGRRR